MTLHRVVFIVALISGMPATLVAARAADSDRAAAAPDSHPASVTPEYRDGESPPSPALPRLGPLTDADPASNSVDPSQFQTPFDGVMGRAVSMGEPAAGPQCAETYQWQLMPQGLIYSPYLASAKESRFGAIWNHETQDDRHIWDVTLGGQVGLLRFGTVGDARPEGWQLGMEGASLVRLDRDENFDVDSSDYRFGIPITWGDSIHQVKFAYYHLSSHLADEFLIKHPGFDRLNYSRNMLVLGQSIYPTDNFRVYGEIGYGFLNDVARPWEFQFGFDYAPTGRTGAHGAPFVTANGHLRQEVNFGGNFVIQTGWAWRRAPASGLFRLGVEYFNGKDDQFSFFDDSVQKFGFGIWYDY